MAGGQARPVALTIAEIVSLVVASHVADGSPYSVAGRSAIDKLLGALDDPQRVAVEHLRSRFRLAPTQRAVLARVMSVVEDAVRDQTVVTISYEDRNGIRTRRAVDPVGLNLDGVHWSLIGWCHLRQAGRMFHHERIRRADKTAQACQPRDPTRCSAGSRDRSAVRDSHSRARSPASGRNEHGRPRGVRAARKSRPPTSTSATVTSERHPSIPTASTTTT